MKEYRVKYEDNTGNGDGIDIYASEEEAEAAIEEELDNVKEVFQSLGYDYGESYSEGGLRTEIWVPGGDEYASWTRLWT